MRVMINSQRSGKTNAAEKQLTDYIKRHPDAVICTARNGEMIIEKPVRGTTLLELPRPSSQGDEPT